MDPVYFCLRKSARKIVSRFPVPDFYRDWDREFHQARWFLETDERLVRLTAFVAERIESDFGHGLTHAVKVAVDAGTLLLAETEVAGADLEGRLHRVRMVQAASLLHDIKRKQTDHAHAGADEANRLLGGFRFRRPDVETICYAIRNHEAFKGQEPPPSREAAVIADCLYDADKFRWGPDNFTDTIWEMVAFSNPPLSEFFRRYPVGMEKLQQIRGTFRSQTGRRYGPQFIDFGIAIGEELLKAILEDFSHLL
jgi:hypothetical protein